MTVPTLAFAQQETPPTGYPQYGYPQPTYPQPTYPQPTQYGNPNQPYPGAQPYPAANRILALSLTRTSLIRTSLIRRSGLPGTTSLIRAVHRVQPAIRIRRRTPAADPQRNPASSAQNRHRNEAGPDRPGAKRPKRALGLPGCDGSLPTGMSSASAAARPSKRRQAGAGPCALGAVERSATCAKSDISTAAKEITRPVSEGERLLIEGMIALAEDQRQVARAAFEAMAALFPADKHAHYYRGRLLLLSVWRSDGAQTDLKNAGAGWQIWSGAQRAGAPGAAPRQHRGSGQRVCQIRRASPQRTECARLACDAAAPQRRAGRRG